MNTDSTWMHRDGYYFIASDGVRIAARIAGPEGAPATVLQHGFASSGREEWGSCGVIDGLLQGGRRVVIVDARGHGESDKPHDPNAYGESRIADDLVELTDSLSLDQVDLVGYSMGAIAALIVASRRPTLVRRLVLGGIGSGVVETGGLDTRALDNASLVQAFRAPDPQRISDPGLAAWRLASDAAGQDHLALAAAAEGIENRGIDLSSIVAPTLILAGDDDPLASRPELLASHIYGAELRVLEGDHMTARFDPAFARGIAEFLSATIGSRPRR